ncbi:MAG: winged helix-turn-helix domain-containing protein [Pseudomonadota bacterium]
MPNYRFDCFSFDSHRLALYRRRERVALRPKTAQVLRALLAADGEVVVKRDLVLAVWGTPHVSDQSLFQAISELRRALAPLEPVVTHPNRGYAWAEKTSVASPRQWLRAAAVAGIAAGAALVLLAAPAFRATPAVAAAKPLPALHALSNGMTSLREQRFAEAERQFGLALAANPQFSEARLLLAETWLAQGDTERARAMAASLLDAGSTAGAYVNVAAMDLLSRTSTVDGTQDAALDWARSAADGARDSGFACAVAELEDRIAQLTSSEQRETPGSEPRQSPVMAAAPSEQPAYCQQIHRELPETGQLERRPAAPGRGYCRAPVLTRSMA